MTSTDCRRTSTCELWEEYTYHTHTHTHMDKHMEKAFFFLNDNVETGSVAKRMVSVCEVLDPITSAKI